MNEENDPKRFAEYFCKACGTRMTLGQRWGMVYRPDMQLGCTSCGVDKPVNEYTFSDGTDVRDPRGES